MKFSISQSVLQTALQHLSKATPTRSTVPILSNVLFATENDLLVLRTTDLEITMISTLKAQIDEAGSIAIDFRTLMDITNALPETIIGFDVSDDYKIKMHTNFGSYDISGTSSEEFPLLPGVDNKKEIRLQSETLGRLIGKTIFAISRDELKPALTGVLIEIGENQISAVATDGHRLVVCSRTDYTSTGYIGEVVIPRKFLALLQQYLSNQGEVVLWVGDNHLTVSIENITIFSRIIEERYPDYQSVIPQDNDKTVKLNRIEFLSSVRRVAIFSNKSTKQINLHLTQNSGTITTEDPESATSAREDFSVDYSGEDIVIGYNANYLGDMLSHIDTDNVLIKLNTPVSAGLVLPEEQAENEELTMLLMPMRTSG